MGTQTWNKSCGFCFSSYNPPASLELSVKEASIISRRDFLDTLPTLFAILKFMQLQIICQCSIFTTVTGYFLFFDNILLSNDIIVFTSKLTWNFWEMNSFSSSTPSEITAIVGGEKATQSLTGVSVCKEAVIILWLYSSE